MQEEQHKEEEKKKNNTRKKKIVLWISEELEALYRAATAGVRMTEKGIRETDNKDVKNLLQGCLREDGYRRSVSAINSKHAAMKKKEKQMIETILEPMDDVTSPEPVSHAPSSPPLTSAEPVVDSDMMPQEDKRHRRHRRRSLNVV